VISSGPVDCAKSCWRLSRPATCSGCDGPIRRDWQDAGRLPELVVEAWRRGLISTRHAGDLIGADIADFERRMKVLGMRQENGAEPVAGLALREMQTLVVIPVR
jgi:hypothetical protein